MTILLRFQCSVLHWVLLLVIKPKMKERQKLRKRKGRGNTIIALLWVLFKSKSTWYFSKGNQIYISLAVDLGHSSWVEILKSKLLVNINQPFPAVISLMLLHGHFCYGHTLQSETTPRPRPHRADRWKKSRLLDWFEPHGALVRPGCCSACAEQNLRLQGELCGNHH